MEGFPDSSKLFNRKTNEIEIKFIFQRFIEKNVSQWIRPAQKLIPTNY